jgi:signal transduction histidine kinase
MEATVGQSQEESTVLARLRKLRWLPVREQTAIEEFAVQGRPIQFLIGLSSIFFLFFIPAVRRSTGIGLKPVLAMWSVLSVWFTLANQLLYRRASRSLGAFYALVFGSMAIGFFITLWMPIVGGKPNSALWSGYAVMACIFGAAETEPSVLIAAIHLLAPLVTIPFFLARGYPPSQAIVWPVVAAVVSGYGYRFLSQRREHWRRDRHEREIELARRRLAESEKERLRLSRDLHDTVGTALSLVALYGGLAEHRAEDPSEARRLGGSIRQAAREALNELRGVLNALPQSATKLDDLATGLALVARRAAEPAGAVMEIEVKQGGSTLLQGDLRVAVVRVFQEAVHNALHHGHASEIRASLAADDDQIELVVTDNGVGFDPKLPSAGTGIAGMRGRALELGGEATLESVPGAGARVRLALPLNAAAPE